MTRGLDSALSGVQDAYNPFGYAGEYTDLESGFVYLRARYYDPSTQQFLSVDPIVAITEQAYNYVAGSPTNFTDPSGEDINWTQVEEDMCQWFGLFCKSYQQDNAFGWDRFARGVQNTGNALGSYFSNPNNTEQLAWQSFQTWQTGGLAPTKGSIKIPLTNKTRITTALGHRRDVRVAEECFGHNILNPDINISWEENRRWLDMIIARKDDIYLASPIDYTKDHFIRSDFRKEIEYLTGKGYLVDSTGTRMYKP